ncbi:MAG: amino acid adenylation domain-containing protein, partial [Methylococcales bacterium]|nr:amino acid adenylation domain-containing protein [Methylococcales bacterium]
MQKLYVKFYTEALQQQNNFFTHQPQWMEKLTQIKQQTDKLKASPNIYHQYVLEQQKTVDEVDTLFYWKQQLAHTNALDMMVKASKISTHRINNSLLIGAEHSQSLKTFCRQLKITPSVYFKAIYAFILQRYCQPDGDFFITEVLSSRQKQHYKAFGCYYQQVPMVFNADDFRPQQTIQSYLLKVKQQIRQLGHFKNISQSQLQQFLPESRLSFLYNFYNFPKQVDFLAQKTSIQQYIPPVAENQVQFIVQAIESEFQLDLYYFESEFNANELLIRMQFISQQILSQTHCLGELDLLSSVEKQQLKSLALIPEKIEFSSVQYQFEQQVKRTPELIAVKQGEQSLSYQQLNQQANQLAYYLKTKNIGANCCVGICLPAGIDILVAMLGILKAGGCYVPLDPNAPEQRLKTMINQISMTLLITTDENSVKAKLNNASAQTKLMPLWYELRETIEILYLEKLNQTLSNLPSDNLEHQTQATDLIYVIFTSGSTGTPKAAGVYHQGFSHLTQWYQQTFQWTTDDSTLIISSFSFDLTQKNLMTPLLCGASVVFAEHSHYDPTSLLSTCRKEKISWLNCAPSAFYPLIENTQNFVALKSLKQLILGGEVIQKSRINHWLQQMPTSFLLTNSYGPTECTDIALFHQIKGGSSISSIPLGQPIDRVQCYLLDNHNQPQPPGIVGEICIAGMGVGAGYINDAEKTQTSFTKLSLFSNDEQTIYHTGDAARINQFGQIEYIGRLDNQVKIRGLRIEIGEIENTLIHLAAIKQAVVVVQNDKLLAYLVVEDRVIPQEDEFCLSTIKQALSNQLTTAMCPSDYLVLDELPLMANGKIDRQRLKTADKSTLPVSLLHSSETNKTIIAASTNTEEILLEQWKSLLGLEKISMDDDFFELGGHSLLATQSAAKIRQQFKIDLPLKSLFEASTIAGLAKAIDTAIEQQPTQHQAIGKMPAQQSKILSFAQQRLWFLSQLDSQSSGYNIPLALRLKGKINEEALQSAIDTVVNRHEILRSNYVTDNGQATVKIQPSISVELEKISLFDLDKQQRQSKTIELAQQHAVHHFNLQTGSLIQVALAEFSKTDHVLLVNMHHIITDAWSAKILITELTIAYHHFLTHSDGQTLALPDLAIQYSDYAYWQQQFLSGEELDKQLSYWKKQLNNRPAVLNFPYDHPRPKVFTTNGNHINFQLPEKLSQQLQQLCQQQQTTLFMTLLAIFQSLLSRYTNQQEISVGTPIAGRQMAETQNLIGFFVNTLIIKTDLSGHPTFRELLQRVKQVTLDAFDHQELPFEQLVDALVDDRDMKIPPLAQAGFSFHHDEQLNLSFDGLDITPVELDYHTAKVDLLLIVSQSNNAIQATWEYNTDLLDDDTIKKLSHHFIRFCEAVCQNDQVQLCFQPLADEKELVEILAVADSDTQAIMPLNSIQRDLYLDSQLNPDTLYNSGGFSLIFDTLINAELWQQAIQWVTNQHLILKSSLQESHQSYLDPVYWVSHKTHTIELEYLADYCDILSPEDCQKLSKQRIEKTYKITQEKLLNHSLITSKSQQSLIILYGHHILLDGISIVFMLQQTLQAYEKLLHQQALHENPEHLYHKDLSFDQADKWLNSVLTPPQVFDQFQTIEFWKQRLIDVEPLHHYKPEKSANNEAVEQLLPISGKQFSALKKLSRQQKTTPVILLKSLYALLLNTLCRADSDFVIYEILAGRQRENRESIGCFYQQLPLVVKSDWLQAEQTLATFFNEIKNSQRQLKQNQYISVLAQTQLIPHAELNFFFNARHFMATMKIDDDSAIMQSYLQFPENQVQLILDLQSTSITCHLHYHSHLFNGAGFLQQLDYLLQQCLDNANSLHETSINQLSWITQVQKNQLCHVSKGAVSSQSNDETIISLIENQVAQTPEQLALCQGDISISYQQLNQQANIIANHLIERGVSPSCLLGIYCERSPDFVVAILAIIKTGAAYIPIDTQYPLQRVQYIIDSAGIGLVLSQQALSNKLESLGIEQLWIDQTDIIDKADDSNPPAITEADDLIYVIYTSGSTGKPKGAGVKHQGFINLVQWYVDEMAMDASDKTLIISATGFDLTQKNLFSLLTVGGTIIFPDELLYDPEALSNLIKQQQITLINCAPSAIYPIIDHCADDQQALSSLKQLILGGESIQPNRLINWLQNPECHCQIINTYGPTECTDVVSYFRVTDMEAYQDKAIPIGRPINNVQCFVTDDNLSLLPAGMVGELVISGIALGSGYLNEEVEKSGFIENDSSEESTSILIADKFILEQPADYSYYKTGDLARVSTDGLIEYIGRKDFQVKLRGLRIELAEIESVMSSLPDIQQSVALVINEQIISFVVTPSTESWDWQIMQTIVQQQLPNYMMPSIAIAIESLPLTANAKIDRNALIDLHHKYRQNSQAIIPPSTTTEIELAEIWQQLLNIDEISIKDGFFELGGHSLLLVQLTSTLQKQFQCNLSLALVMQHNTLENMAKLIEQGGDSEQNQILIPLQLSGQHSPLFCVHAVDGQLLAFNELANSLADHCPVYAFQSPSDNDAPSTIETMATHYIQALKLIKPEGPYQLAGYSFGGLLAFEICKQLIDQG